MRATITIDDALYEKALEMAGPSSYDKDGLFHEALLVFVRLHARRRLIAAGGKQPSMQGVPRGCRCARCSTLMAATDDAGVSVLPGPDELR